MLSTHTNKVYYIGTKIRETSSNKEGVIYRINVLGSTGIRVIFNDNTKKAYFGNQLLGLVIIT